MADVLVHVVPVAAGPCKSFFALGGLVELRVDPCLRSLIPPLTEVEWRELEDSIKAEGCRDPIVTWNGAIIDGHNRYDICRNNSIEFRTVDREFSDIDAAKVWIITSQLARRNVPLFVRCELSDIRKAILVEKGKQTQGKRTDLLSTTDKKSEPHDTRKTLAAEIGVGTGTLARADYVTKHAPEDIKEQARRNELSINEAYKQTKRLEVKSLDNEETAQAFPTGKYRVIYVDPPWPISKSVWDKWEESVKAKYPTMTVADIILLPVHDLAGDDTHLFLWSTLTTLPDALQVITAWGFKYHICLTWNKRRGFTLFGYHRCSELLLHAYRGKMPAKWEGKAFPTVFEEAAREHSRKPDMVYEFLEARYEEPRLEMFSRLQRPGWEGWGNDSR